MAQTILNLYPSYIWHDFRASVSPLGIRQTIGKIVYPTLPEGSVYDEVSLSVPMQDPLAQAKYDLEFIIQLAADDRLLTEAEKVDYRVAGTTENRQKLKELYDELAATFAAALAEFVPQDVRWMVWVVAGNGTGFWESAVPES